MATHFKGPLVINGGNGIAKVVKGTIAVDPASITANTSAETAVTITGATTSDVIIFNVPASLETGLAFSGARISAADTVQLRLTNATGSDIDGSSRTWTYLLIQF